MLGLAIECSELAPRRERLSAFRSSALGPLLYGKGQYLLVVPQSFVDEPESSPRLPNRDSRDAGTPLEAFMRVPKIVAVLLHCIQHDVAPLPKRIYQVFKYVTVHPQRILNHVRLIAPQGFVGILRGLLILPHGSQNDVPISLEGIARELQGQPILPRGRQHDATVALEGIVR